METTVINATEYRNVSLSLLSESKTNPRRIFEDAALKELCESIRTQGVLSPLLVRPLTENGFEIVAGARRYRAAQMAEAGYGAHPHRQHERRTSLRGAVGRKPDSRRRSSDGGSTGIQSFAGFGRPNLLD